MDKKLFYKKKKEAWSFYNGWGKQRTYSPAIRETILATRNGWNHLIGINRTKREVTRRIRLLKTAKYLILNSTTFQDITWRKNTRYYIIEAIQEIKERDEELLLKVRVVLKENRLKKLEFHSVMDDAIGKRK